MGRTKELYEEEMLKNEIVEEVLAFFTDKPKKRQIYKEMILNDFNEQEFIELY